MQKGCKLTDKLDKNGLVFEIDIFEIHIDALKLVKLDEGHNLADHIHTLVVGGQGL
ncbi:hypothetical protein D3C81_1869920 [compost metagenome]